MNVGIIGLGLMGGAIAIALREKCCISKERLSACDTDSGVLNMAKEQGLISQCYEKNKAGEMLSACDVVFICLNPSAVISFIEKWHNFFKPGSLVTDIAGTKAGIASAVCALHEKNEEQQTAAFDFIPGHPMAGSHYPSSAQKSGFENARLVDFTGKNYILTPLPNNKPENINLLKNIILQMGFKKITEVTPEEHDSKIAFTSQLCHVIAASLIDCESDTEITRFGGGSFEDLTRIAMLNAPMWTELFLENCASLLERINQFEKSLDVFKALIENAETEELKKKLELVRDRRAKMNK